MKEKRKKELYSVLLVLLIIGISLGYAALSATLNINGFSKVKDNTWDIHFKNLQVNSNSVSLSTGDNAATINPSDNKEVTYNVTLKKPGDFYEFTVDAKNFGTIDGMIESVTSKLNGTVIDNEHPLPVFLDYSVTYSDDIPIDSYHLLTAGSFVTYKVHLEFKKDIDESDLPENDITPSFSFGITSIQSDSNAIIKPEWPVIQATYWGDNTKFRSDTYREKIKTINLDDEINPPANPVESWDIGVAQNGNVMAYLTENSDDNTMYDLYIHGDGSLYANPNSNFMFNNLKNVDSINMDVLDTTKVTTMQYMFNNTGYNSTVFTLDLGNKFDTSKVTNMSYMFSNIGHNSTVFTLDLGSKFDTSSVVNMLGMFLDTGYSSKVLTIDLGDKFDTSNVTDMSGMFSSTGFNSPVFTLDLGPKFDTSNVVNISGIFQYAGYSSKVLTLDLGDKFDTSNVTNMNSMFYCIGVNNPNFTLDLGSKFDTSKVTNMSSMFSATGANSTVFTLNLGNKFDTSKVTNMSGMFSSTGQNSTIFTLDLGSKFDTSNVTNMESMFALTGSNSSVFTLNLGNKFNTSNVTDMKNMFTSVGYSNSLFELDLSTFDFSNVASYNGIFSGFKATQKIYVKDAADQSWIINNANNSNLTTANVLIKS